MSIDLRDAYKSEQERQAQYLPTRGVVRSVQPERDGVKIDVAGSPGTSTIAVRHPYIGASSWFRVMPEPGTSVMVQLTGDPRQNEIWGYLSHQAAGMVKKAQDESNNFIYRELRSGELEIMSSGRAYSHWGEDGNLSLYGGVLEHHLLQTDLELVSRGPTYRRNLHLQAQNEPLAHSELFGLVKRPDQKKPYSYQRFIKDSAEAYQYEYGRWLVDDDGQAIVTLHEGHLYDVAGNEVKNGKTNRRVRHQKTVYHAQQQGDVTLEIDEELNIVLVNSSQAKTTDLDFGVQNEIKIASKKFDLSIIQSSSQQFSQSLTVTSPKVRINSPDVGFGAVPSQQAILGTAFVNSVLTPVLGMLSSMVAIIGAEPAMSPAAKASMAGLATSFSSLAASTSSVLSSEVKFTK